MATNSISICRSPKNFFSSLTSFYRTNSRPSSPLIHPPHPYLHTLRTFRTESPAKSGESSSSSSSSDASSSSGESSTPLSSRGPYSSRLASRGIIRFDGPETVSFLQGLVTNDLRKFDQKPPPPSGAAVPTVNEPTTTHSPLYAAILNPQGRFLYDLFFYRPGKAAERLSRDGSGPASNGQDVPELLADVDATVLDEILALLKKHKLRAKVNFEDFSKDMEVWTRYAGVLKEDPGAPSEEESGGMGYGGSDDVLAKAASETSTSGWLWHKDSRLASLGLRGIFPSGSVPPLVEAQEEVGEEYYKLWRYENGVAEGSTEIPKGEALPLEYNLDGLNAVSFDKGCYVGQELTARTHHRGVIRKRLVPVHFVSPTKDEELNKAAVPGAEIVDSSSNKKAGKVVAALGPRGLAHLRLEIAFKDSVELKINEEDGAIVNPSKPKWWPSQWIQESNGEVKETTAN